MKKLLSSVYENKILLTAISLVVFLFSVLFMYKLLNETRVYVEFEKLRPFHEKAPVYFRGFKIGKVVKVQPSNDYQNTLMTIVLYPNDLKLPVNTTAHLKVHKTRWMHRDYIDLIYPQSPADSYLKRGAKISGKSSIDIHSYLANIPHESYEKMEENVAGILENLDDTTGMLYSVFAIINGILTESESNIKDTFENFSQTSKITTHMMKKIDNSMPEVQLKQTFNNIYETTNGVKTAVDGLNGFSQQINTAIPTVETALFNTNCLISNLNEITCGIKRVIRKRFSGLRLLFGRIL